MAVTVGSVAMVGGDRTTVPGRPLMTVVLGGRQQDQVPCAYVVYEEGPGIRATEVVVVETGKTVPDTARRCVGAVSPSYGWVLVAFAVNEVAESAAQLQTGVVSAIGSSPATLQGLLRKLI